MKSTPTYLMDDVIDEETQRLRNEAGDFVADTFQEIATGKATVLETFIPDWEKHQLARGLVEKTVSQMKSDLTLLTEYIHTTTMVDSKNCDAWINLIAQSNGYKSSSVTRIISACNNFYRYLQDISVFDESASSPFKVPKNYRQSKKPNAKQINKRGSWAPFTKKEVEALYLAAHKKGDTDLADLIAIAAYTGSRIEELCALQKDFIDLGDKTLTIVDAKTDAGNRVVPIHEDIFKTVEKLFQNSSNNYLFDKLSSNKYGDRSNAIGKRFGRLKKEHGHGSQHVFHSIRKTFTTELERAGISENIAADIVGHEKQTMTYGLYSGGSSLDQKRKAISKVKFNF